MKKNINKMFVITRYKNGMKNGTIAKNLNIPLKEVEEIIKEYKKRENLRKLSNDYNKEIQEAQFGKQAGRSEWITKIIKR